MKTGRHWRVLGIVSGVLVVDQITKAWAVSGLADGPVSLIGSAVQLNLTRNSGSAFGIVQGATPVLALIAMLIAIFLVRAMRSARSQAMLIALALVLGGAMGNLVDRLTRDPGFLRGHVVDFIDVGAWPIFNIADSAITIGSVLMVLATASTQRQAGEST